MSVIVRIVFGTRMAEERVREGGIGVTDTVKLLIYQPTRICKLFAIGRARMRVQVRPIKEVNVFVTHDVIFPNTFDLLDCQITSTPVEFSISLVHHPVNSPLFISITDSLGDGEDKE